MAEFQEVMEQLNRMCKAHSNCEDDECPVHAMGCCGNIGSHCSEPLQAERIEKTVMQWAAEHPEPVFPTWFEWLTDMGAIPKAISWDETLVEAVYDAIQNHIPADIAQKLGIEPKEG